MELNFWHWLSGCIATTIVSLSIVGALGLIFFKVFVYEDPPDEVDIHELEMLLGEPWKIE